MTDQNGRVPAGTLRHRNTVVLFTDVRGFSGWCAERRAPNSMIQFVEDYLALFSKVFSNPPPDFEKFLGDGFLAVWVRQSEKTARTKSLDESILRMATSFYKKYRRIVEAYREPRPPSSIGIGILGGMTYEVKVGHPPSLDYIGYHMNLAARLQKLAQPEGIVIEADQFLSRVEKERLLRRWDHERGVAIRGFEKPFDLWVSPEVSVDLLALSNAESSYTSAMKSEHDLVRTEAQKAMAAFRRRLDAIDSRTLEFRGDSVYEEYDGILSSRLSGPGSSYNAVTFISDPFWCDPKVFDFLDANMEALRRGCRITRIFVYKDVPELQKYAYVVDHQLFLRSQLRRAERERFRLKLASHSEATQWLGADVRDIGIASARDFRAILQLQLGEESPKATIKLDPKEVDRETVDIGKLSDRAADASEHLSRLKRPAVPKEDMYYFYSMIAADYHTYRRPQELEDFRDFEFKILEHEIDECREELRKGESEELRILDIGCGNGQHIERLVQQFDDVSVLGIDYCPRMVEQCRRRLMLQRVQIEEMDARDARLKSEGTFSVAFAFCTLPVIDRWEAVLENMAACADRLVFSIYSPGSFRVFESFYQGNRHRISQHDMNGFTIRGGFKYRYLRATVIRDRLAKLGFSVDVRRNSIGTVYVARRRPT